MKPEQLLKRRIKLKADWPGCQWPVGTIFPDNFDDFKKWPHLFEELFWWEEREEKDMPEYVLFSESPDKTVCKVSEWMNTSKGIACSIERYPKRLWYPNESSLLPATESEYNDYLNQSK